jgi:hypothetical protein
MNTLLSRSRLFRFVPVLFILIAGVGLTAGCASKPATTAVSVARKDINFLRPGIPRADVLREFGKPLSETNSKAGDRVDIFSFVQDTHANNGVPRPIEPEEQDDHEMKILLKQFGVSPDAMFDGQTLTVQVNYDATDRVASCFLLDMTK